MNKYSKKSRASGLNPEELSRLAMERRARRGRAGARGAVPRRPPGGSPALASFAQQRLWLLSRIQPHSAAYNMPFAYRLRGPLDEGALAAALAEVARRHEALRTTFGEDDGQPVQRIAPPGARGVELAVEDLSGLPPGESDGAARSRLDTEAARPFDLARGPLARARLLRLGPDDHRLLLVFHHAVFDGWSLAMLWRELTALYRAYARGRPSPLDAPALQYADFALWQRERMSGEGLDRHLDFWRERLAGGPRPLELPADRPRPAQPSDRGALVPWTLPAEVGSRLRRIARARGSSLFMVLLAGFQALLARLAGQDDFVVGVPQAGRGRTELEGVIGFFVNALPVRARLDGAPTFSDLLARTRRELLDATAHQDVPVEKLLEELQPERSLSRAPLFQVMFNMVDLPSAPPDLEGVEVEEHPLGFHPSKFDLTVYAETRGDAVDLELLYSTELFDRARMEAFLDQFEQLLGRFAERPEAAVRDVPLVTERARRVLPDPRQPLPADWRGAIHEALGRHARTKPARTAAADPAGEVSYGELALRAGRLARRLRDLGVDRGDAVAILAHRDASLPVAVFGVLQAGGVFAIFDPAYPDARLAAYLERLAPRAVVELAAAGSLGPEAEAALASGRCAGTIRLPARGSAAEGRFLEDEPGRIPEATVGRDEPACVVFTSGSTGAAKAVVGRHGSLTHFLPWMAERFRLGPEDRFSVLSALSHDPLQRELFVPVWLGAKMVFPEPDRLGEPGWLAAWMARDGITVAALTPATIQLLAEPAAEGAHRTAPALRQAHVVGEALTRGHVERLRRVAPAARSVNFYGATETQRALGFHEVDPDASGSEVVPIGRGMPGAQLLVLRAGGALAGVGEPGEIHVRSPHLALGYLGDEALTARRFLANPFRPEAGDGDRLYRTGDRGRYLPDGEVEYIGRTDRQVQVRGFRVETAEVESTLVRHPDLAECAVAARDDLPGGPGLAAYVVPVRGADADAAALRAHLSVRLPDYMVPGVFVVLERLPRGRTGKVDRGALPAPTPEDQAPGAGRGAPRSEAEELLAGLWCELLGLPVVGVEEDFFALGGHSLLATRLVARIRSAFGREVPLAALFEEPTIAALAARLEAPADGDTLPAVRPLSDAEQARGVPLSWGQRRLWFLTRLEEGASEAYHVVQALELQGPLDVRALERALEGLVRRHEPLRTRIEETEDGDLLQRIDPPRPAAPPREDLSAVPAERRDEVLLEVVEAIGRRPFDLCREAPVRWSLVRMEEHRHVLVTVLHHVAGDAWSVGVLYRDLAALYRAGATGRAPDLPDLPIRYADWAVWQRRWLAGAELERQLAHWTEHLAGVTPVIELPPDRPRPAQQSFRGRRVQAALGDPVTRALKGFCRSQSLTPFMVLLAAFGTVLGRSSGRDDLVLGTPIANRRGRETEDLIGLFANTLALRIDLRGGPGLRELGARVRRTALGAFANQDLPFERLVDVLDVPRDLSRPPLAQVLFAFQNVPAQDLDLPDLAARPLPLGSTRSQSDLFLQAVDGARGVELHLEYCADLYDEATTLRFLGRFRTVLERALDAPETPVDALPLLSAEEERTVRAAESGRPLEVPEPGTLHGMVAARAARHPDREAIASGSERWTYRELVAAGRRLGRYLASVGVGPEEPVGVLLERSPALVVALLGVLEAGGCYVPLDPSYPEERLALMAADAGVRLLVTEAGVRGPELPEVRCVVLDGRDREPIEALEPEPVASAAGPGHLAYVLYTSGSTGRPKGVQVSHGSVASFLASMAREPGVSAGDSVLAATTVSFDISVLELFLPLAVGGRVVLVSRETASDGPALARALREVTVAQATPTTWRMLFESGWRGDGRLRVLSGGEPLERALADRLAAGSAEVWNVYGPTETTVWSTAGRVASGRGAVAVGRPIGNTCLRVVDPRSRPVPLGSPGEIWIAGAGVARGYRGRPAGTAERFVPDPGPGRPGARAYRTGDLGRWRPDGSLECLGRLDQQVKVRGHRIEPGEVEAALLDRSDVARAVVVPFRGVNGSGSPRLAAYLVPEPGREPTVETLRAGLGARLPAYMVPAAFVVLPELPTTPNGKVDRRALPAPDVDRRTLEERFVEPEGEAERALAAVWEEVLGVEAVGARDGFFALGGDSILALQMVSRAARAGWILAVRDLFRHGTLRALAAVARRAEATDDEASAGGRGRAGDSTRFAEDGSHLEADLSPEELEELLAEIG